MKSINDFKKDQIQLDNLNSIQGGMYPLVSTGSAANCDCDILHDLNGDGAISPGECVDYVACE